METRFFTSGHSNRSHQAIDHSLLLTDIVCLMQDFILPDKQDSTCKAVNQKINDLNLNKLKKEERIALIDTAIKCGSLDLVKIISEKYITLGYADDIRIPYKGHGEYPYRPVFWLAAICTRAPNILVENYDKIEAYLCQTFNIPHSVNINGVNVTRNQYVQIINDWKNEQNEKLKMRGRKDNRY